MFPSPAAQVQPRAGRLDPVCKPTVQYRNELACTTRANKPGGTPRRPQGAQPLQSNCKGKEPPPALNKQKVETFEIFPSQEPAQPLLPPAHLLRAVPAAGRPSSAPCCPGTPRRARRHCGQRSLQRPVRQQSFSFQGTTNLLTKPGAFRSVYAKKSLSKDIQSARASRCSGGSRCCCRTFLPYLQFPSLLYHCFTVTRKLSPRDDGSDSLPISQMMNCHI